MFKNIKEKVTIFVIEKKTKFRAELPTASFLFQQYLSWQLQLVEKNWTLEILIINHARDVWLAKSKNAKNCY